MEFGFKSEYFHFFSVTTMTCPLKERHFRGSASFTLQIASLGYDVNPDGLISGESHMGCFFMTENSFEDCKHCIQLFCPFTRLLENAWCSVSGRQCMCNLWMLCKGLKQDGGKLLTSLVGNLHQRVRRCKLVWTKTPSRMPCSPTKQVNYQILLLSPD